MGSGITQCSSVVGSNNCSVNVANNHIDPLTMFIIIIIILQFKVS